MSTITAILEPHEDGSLHLPVPPELRGGKIRIEAVLERVEDSSAAQAEATPRAGCLKGFWMAPDFDEPLEDFKEYME